MKKIIILLFLLVFIAGCGQTSTGPSANTPFLGGNVGLELAFEPGAPPDEVYDKSGGSYPFDIDLRIKNSGESDILAGDLNVRIMGFLPEDFGKSASDLNLQNDQLIERTEKDSDGNVIVGTEMNLGISGLEFQPEITGNLDFPIRADVCYKYTTTVNSKLCYKEDLTDMEDNKVCSPRESKTVYNSGAPVHVSSLEEKVVGTDKISFSFTVEKSATGNVWRAGTAGYTCAWDLPDSESERNYEEQILVEVNTGLGSGLDCPALTGCSGDTCSGEVKLYNGQRIIRCNQERTSAVDFEKIVNIKLTYNFEQSLQNTLLVKHGI